MINKIFWQVDKIGIISNHLEAENHRHWMLQLFIGLEDLVEIRIEDQLIKCEGIVVDKNIPHSFSAKKKLYYSAIIEPTSEYAEQLMVKVNEHGYWIVDKGEMAKLRQQGQALVNDSDMKKYLSFEQDLSAYLEIVPFKKEFDERIENLLKMIEMCECYDHTVAAYARRLYLSPSRLAHLFKEQIGVPLKSYLVLHQLERAFKEIVNGKSITEAALLAGFGTPSHFSSTVKRMMGMPVSLSLKDSEFLKVN